VTLGLPRLIEIVDARRVPSTPTMTIYLEKEYGKSKEKATEIARRIIHTTVKDITQAMYIDPKTGGIIMKMDAARMRERGVTVDELGEEVFDIPDCSIKFQEDQILIEPKKPLDAKKILEKVSSRHVRGLPGIRRVLVAEEEGEWVIRTDGSNLPKIFDIEGVDPSKTTTNNIHEIAKTLGIEAARNALIRESVSVLEEQGLDVDLRHIMLVSDIMTATSDVRQIGRHGISGEKSSVLARAAFEITIPNIVEAAVKGESDPLKGVTENVIVGQAIPIGTGLVDIYMSAAPPTEEDEEKGG